MSEDLKPCPFCGSKNIKYDLRYDGLHKLQCKGCGVSVFDWSEKNRCYAKWDIRSNNIDDMLLQEIYSLREKLKIAIAAIKADNPEFDDQLFVHQLNSVDFDQLMEELGDSKSWKDPGESECMA